MNINKNHKTNNNKNHKININKNLKMNNNVKMQHSNNNLNQKNIKSSFKFRTALIAIIMLFSLSFTNCTNAAQKVYSEKAVVSKVVDGDTIQVNINGKKKTVRMIGVDTPETVHPKKPVQFYGKEASDFSKKNLKDKTVYLQRDVSDTDKYGRILRYVWLVEPSSDYPKDEEIIKNMYNAILVKEGYAYASTYQPDSKHSKLFSKLQRQAAEKSIGLWNADAEKKFNSKVKGNGKDSNQNSSSRSTNSKSTNNNSANKDNTSQRKIKGNKKSKIYHMPGSSGYNKISEKNVIFFNSEKEAQNAGYKKAKR